MAPEQMRMRYVPGIERGTVRVEHRNRVERVGDGGAGMVGEHSVT